MFSFIESKDMKYNHCDNKTTISLNSKKGLLERRQSPLYANLLGRIELAVKGIFYVIMGIGYFAASGTLKILNAKEKSGELFALGICFTSTGLNRVTAAYTFRHRLIASAINSPRDLKKPFNKEVFEEKLKEISKTHTPRRRRRRAGRARPTAGRASGRTRSPRRRSCRRRPGRRPAAHRRRSAGRA